MDDRIVNIEKVQAEMQENLKKAQEEMREQIMKAQDDMMAKLVSLLQGNSAVQGEALVICPAAEEPLYPPGFTPPYIHTQQATIIQPKKIQKNDRLCGKRSAINSLFSRKFGRISNPLNFADIVNTGEMIEMAIKSGKLDGGESSRKPLVRRKDNEVSNVKKYDYNNITVSRPPATASSALNPVQHGVKEPRQKREMVQFDPIPMSYKELFQILYDKHVVSPYHTSPIQPPYTKWFDINAQCEYHAGASGHSIENCMAFKKLVQRLRQRNIINFGDSEQPNVAQNPLPNHAGTGVNVVIEERVNKVITKVNEVKSPMHWVWGKMVKIGWLTFNVNGNKHACPYHRCEDHVIQNYDEFKALVQRLMDSKDMEFYHEAMEEEEVEICASEGTSKGVYNSNCPLVIMPKARTVENITPKVMIIPPSSFPYKDSKQVPWRYECHLGDVGVSKGAKEEMDEVGHFTRSGRCYSPNSTNEPEKIATPDKGKKVEIQLKDDEPTINEPVTENEAVEFLKFLKHSEYRIVEQLHKLPARISILALLLSSEAHRNALMKVLNQTFVPKDVPVEKIDRLVANIQADNFISFSDDEIPSGMMGNPKALHITIRCKGHVLSRVLIDNGSALNVMPLVTLKKLPVDSTYMRNCQSIVRAFEGTKKEVLGKIDIPLTIGPSTYEVEFLEDIIASISTTAPYVKIDEDAVECSFRALEFINATFVAERKKISKPRLSNCTKMELKMTMGRGAKVGRWLGSRLQGNISPVFPGIKRDRFGLGYRPTLKEKLKNVQKSQERRKARLVGEDIKWEPMNFPLLRDTFISGGHMFQGSRSSKESVIENTLKDLGINVILEEGIEDGRAMGIYPAPPGFVLNNWTAEELPIDFELPICQVEIEGYDSDEGSHLSSEQLKMVEREDKQIMPHEEPIEILNLGSEEDKKEIKIGTIISAEGRQSLIQLLREYRDVFAWSYEDMPGIKSVSSCEDSNDEDEDGVDIYMVKLKPWLDLKALAIDTKQWRFANADL
ncbi:uncharacterized protein LOC120116692 [Hibiscus syriacus]|uniref:uncharacterized protein LOC120116692 n=1 Tax=Hibiscus syriacus TaxID=106335 RepID=UPI0019204D8D|nr:uncharacterized protein LOC120116692 [Hibiscus syriacus]